MQEIWFDDLVVVNSFEENIVIGGNMSPFSVTSNWESDDDAMLGLYNDGNGWQWVDGTPANFTFWKNNTTPTIDQTGFGILEFGGEINYKNRWRYGDYNLTDALQGDALFVCQKVLFEEKQVLKLGDILNKKRKNHQKAIKV